MLDNSRSAWAVVAIASIATAISRKVTAVGNRGKEIVVQPAVIRSPQRSAVVRIHVPVAVGLQKAHQVTVYMEVAGHVVRVLHVDARRGVLNRQIPGHRVAGLGNAARQINVDSRIASSVRPGTIYRPYKSR